MDLEPSTFQPNFERPLDFVPNFAPIMRVQLQPQELPLELSHVRVYAELNGGFAHTTLEFTFYNPNYRTLEGQLQIPLLDGQSVTGLALDFNGHWRDAVAIEKPRAAQIFEDVTRAQIDPALLSKTRGNNYRLRVYPLFGRGTRKVRLEISEKLEMHQIDGKTQSSYRLPLHLGLVKNLELQVLSSAAILEVRGLDATLQMSHGLRFNPQNIELQHVLELRLEVPQQPEVWHCHQNNLGFVLARIPKPQSPVPALIPQQITLFWDCSLSGLQRDHASEIRLLEGYFKHFPDLTVHLICLRQTAAPVQTFVLQEGNWPLLRSVLQNIIYDGGSSFSALEEPQPSSDLCLLFSDGLDTLTPNRVTGLKVPLFCIFSSVGSDAARLRGLSKRSGGRAVSLSELERDHALAVLQEAQPRLEQLQAEGAKQVVLHEDRFNWFVAAKTDTLEGDVTLLYALEGKNQTLSIPKNAPENAQISRLWANWYVEDLEGDAHLNVAEIRRIGKDFAIPTSQTSLLILETLEDYLRYQVPLPPDLKDAHTGQIHFGQNINERNQLERVWQMLEQYKTWWNRDYHSLPAKLKMSEPPSSATMQARAVGGMAPEGFGSSAPNLPDPILPEYAAEARPPSAEMAADFQSPGTVETEYIIDVEQDTDFLYDMDSSEAPTVSAPTALFSIAVNQAAPAPAPSSEPAPPSSSTSRIHIQAWSSEAGYIKRMQQAQTEDLYRIYLDERPDFLTSPAFFFDVADVLMNRGLEELALQVLGNIAELELEHRGLLRILGYRYLQYHRPDLAVLVFAEVERLAPYEPQSYRDLGLTYTALERYQDAVDQFYQVVKQPWDERFPQIEMIALSELNALLDRFPQLTSSLVDSRLRASCPLDLRVVLSWDADDTDLDLWVTGPDGEKVFYGNPLGAAGGRLSPDFRRGYGPEEFTLRRASAGIYRVEANYYGSTSQLLSSGVTLQLRLITAFARAEQHEQLITLRLEGQGSTVFIGEFEVGAKLS